MTVEVAKTVLGCSRRLVPTYAISFFFGGHLGCFVSFKAFLMGKDWVNWIEQWSGSYLTFSQDFKTLRVTPLFVLLCFVFLKIKSGTWSYIQLQLCRKKLLALLCEEKPKDKPGTDLLLWEKPMSCGKLETRLCVGAVKGLIGTQQKLPLSLLLGGLGRCGLMQWDPVGPQGRMGPRWQPLSQRHVMREISRLESAGPHHVHRLEKVGHADWSERSGQVRLKLSV